MSAPAVESRRVLVTGLSTYWGGRLAQRLEKDPSIDVIIGVDSRDPRCELERTEFVRVGTQHALIRRIIDAAQIDTVIDTRLVVDSVWTSARAAHENNVIGTMNIVTACDGRDSPVRKLVFKSSAHWYGCERDDPAFFTEAMQRPHPPHTPIERDIVEAEATLRDFAERNRDKTVTVLRFANALGPTITTSHTRLFGLPAVPSILGFDPRYQFFHEDDIVGVLHHAVREDLHGIYNGAADGVLAFSEVVGLLGKLPLPILPPWGTGVAAGPLNRLGLRIPVEMLNQLRYGRGLDNRKLKASGYRPRYTTREAVADYAEHLRVRRIRENAREPYRYEREVEEFLRWSPSVHRSADSPPGAPTRQVSGRGYDDLEAREVVALLPSLPAGDLQELRRHEAQGARRPEVLQEIDRLLTNQEVRQRST
ncbi:MAG: UDP-glucose 4-epimerase [Solirubrobacteraceae bacterium]|jgi:UDP-glucose 4-epimerase|nr:UDP-glucose 4-epimerase [Solirubrobacteraceae bacterium]